MFYRRYLRDSSVSVPRTTLWRYGYDGKNICINKRHVYTGIIIIMNNM